MAEAEKTPRRSGKRIGCAIYTRKSTDEGLDQAFNSLDAQREACAAFVLSQKHVVINRLCSFLADPKAILDGVDKESQGGTRRGQLIHRGRQMADELRAQPPDKVKADAHGTVVSGGRPR